MENFSKKNIGFTITELLIVMSIIVLMSTVVWANYSDSNRQFSLERSVNQVAQGIRMVLEKAMSVKIPEYTPDDFKGGYGVFFEENKNYYVVFIDTDNDGEFGLLDDIIEEISFEKGVKIQNIYLFGGSNCNGSAKSVVFLPPDPAVFVGGKTNEEKSKCDKMEIILSREGLNMTKKVMVNRLGLIELE